MQHHFLKRRFPSGPYWRSNQQIEKRDRQRHCGRGPKKYDILIIGRGGKSNGALPPLGGVAGKIISASLHPALWLAGHVLPEHKDILIGLDGSENSIKAVKHASRMACESSRGICLCSAVRKVTLPFGELDGTVSDDWGEKASEEMARAHALWIEN